MYQANGQVKNSIVNGLSVLTMTRDQAKFVLPPLPVKAERIYCIRSDIVPAEHDYKVVLSGFPLYITSGDRLAILELRNGKFSFTQFNGPAMEEAVQMRVIARMAAFNSALASGSATPN